MTPIPALAIAGWEISLETVVIGALTGLTYAVLAAGLVLVYRATGVINFAHGQIGALGAAVLALLVIDYRWNFFLALALVLLLGGALGAAVELGVVRRLFKAPRLILLVATIGVAQLVFVLEVLLPEIENKGRRYPTPLTWTAELQDLLLNGEHFMIIVCVPAVIVGLTLFLNRTRHGLAIRACADNADRAELVGISTRRVSTMVWVLAGVLATFSAVLINPVRGTIVGLPTQALGPGLMLRALTAALAGGFVSLPTALAGGIAIGVVEAVFFANVANPGAVDMLLFAVVLVLVYVRRTVSADEAGAWSLSPRIAAIPERVRSVWWIARLNLLVGTAAVVVAALLPLVFTTSERNFLFSRVVLFALIGLSVTVLTGWAGQLSLGQFAFVGLGAMVCVALDQRGMAFGYAVAFATIAGTLAAVLVGFPALRVRGLFLAVTTLAFAVAARGWILVQEVFIGDSNVVFLPRGEWLGVDLRSERAYYYVCLTVFVLVVLAVGRLRSSGIGRTIVATRENEAAAATFTISPALAKLTAFAVSGGVAALAGALFAGLRVQFEADAFSPELSLQVVAMVIIGGLGSIAGAVLGAIYVVGLPAFFNDSATVGLATSGIGLLVFLLYVPGGLMQFVYRLRAVLVDRASGRLAATPAPLRTEALPLSTRRSPNGSGAETTAGDQAPSGDVALAASNITVRFGGRVALQAVSIEARRGEVVGLIGANGAGKSTLMNVISGFVKPEIGSIALGGVDITSLAPYERARAGVGRVFQDARLFGELTVADTVKVALESHERSELVPSMLSLPPARRAEAEKSADAQSYISFLGLGRYADRFVADLSTGTRRIVELCCLLAQGADVLLLDEPTAGVAQREAEAFGPLIKRIQKELGATIVVIEHDIPLVMSMSDRVYCLTAGSVIAEGIPGVVRDDPAVVAAYLGTDERAIARSGVLS